MYNRNKESIYLRILVLPSPASLLDNINRRIKDTHRGKAPLCKTPALTKSTNMGIWVVGTSNHIIPGSEIVLIKSPLFFFSFGLFEIFVHLSNFSLSN